MWSLRLQQVPQILFTLHRADLDNIATANDIQARYHNKNNCKTATSTFLTTHLSIWMDYDTCYRIA